MKTVKKNARVRRNRRIIPIMIILFMLLAISVAFLAYVYTQNYINVEYIDKTSSKLKSDEVSNVSPIIINNIVVGGVTDKGKWINENSTYEKRNIKAGTEIDVYSKIGKMGTFEIYSANHDKDKKIIYAMPLMDIADQEYIALGKSDTNAMVRKLVKIDVTEDDVKAVKNALGKYRLLNNTVKINEAYEVYLDTDQKTRIISATSAGKNMFGVYSVLVGVNGNKSNIIKYSYVKNTESSVNWPVYSIKFACDLNKDNRYELVIQETREVTMKYSILEYRKDKYYEVIGFKFNI